MITEFTDSFVGVWKANKGSLLRTVIYTIGHFIIAICCLMIIADVTIREAATDAIVEPLLNSLWYFILDKWWTTNVKKTKRKT
jgi:uncharacterized membrane protein